ncbi:MAG: hypothetical protein K1W33_07500 [Clostridia bacterium]
MQLPIEMRLKIRHWFKKYGKIVFFVFVVWSIIFIVNKFLGEYAIEPAPNTTYTPTVSVLDQSETAPSKVQIAAETMAEEYVDACNQGKYQKAFAMLSEDCKKYEFEDDVENFARHVLEKLPTPKKYSIQNYSNYDKYYIYEVKYFDDFLATGLTNSEYTYTTEKIVLTKNSKGGYDIAVGNFIGYEDINNISENEYLKIDIKNKLVRYSTETYEVVFTNRTEDIIVVADNFQESEVALTLSNEYRGMENSNTTIVLEPGESKTFWLGFMKFADDGDKSQSILFGNIRVLEEYAGTESKKEDKQAEIDKAVAKFSMNIPVK